MEPKEAWKAIRSGALLLDVRTPEEYALHIEGAVNIPYDQIFDRLSELGEDKNREIILYCRSGQRSGIATNTLKKAGFINAHNAGGYDDLNENR